jgi:hypothetical protein
MQLAVVVDCSGAVEVGVIGEVAGDGRGVVKGRGEYNLDGVVGVVDGLAEGE